MKCGDCGQVIPKSRGYCITARCHNKAIGGNTPDRQKPLKSWRRMDKKRCPFCAGEEEFSTKCFISACDRGPGGKSCGCHYMLSGMGVPGLEGRIRAQKYARSVA